MPSRHQKLHIAFAEVPRLWLLSDMRNEFVLDKAIAALPAASGVVFRHYHLEKDARRARFDIVFCIARKHGHKIILSGNLDLAEKWGADGIYGSAEKIEQGKGVFRLATAHDQAELDRANQVSANAVMISPVFATRSHRDARLLGISGFCKLAAAAHCPAIALGGMNACTFAQIPEGMAHGWAAIDGLSDSTA